MRKKIVAGNWKMNKNLEEGLSLASEIIHMAKDELDQNVNLVLAPPFIHLNSVRNLLKGESNIFLAAQNCSQHESGAYTGEISVTMLKSVGAKFVILGHSERREYFGERNELLEQKVKVVLDSGLIPIFCCGEPLEIREYETHFEFVCQQLTESLWHLDPSDMAKIVIAYEPIWAIGTGKTASSEQAQEMHQAIRRHVEKQFGEEIAENLSILYGGSCKPGNAEEIFAGADVDGGLIGGASLKSRDFIDIAKSF